VVRAIINHSKKLGSRKPDSVQVIYMFRSLASLPSLLGLIVIISIAVGKYLQSPLIFLLSIIVMSIFYRKYTNKKNNKIGNSEETLINISKFIIVTGILGFVIVRIMSLLFLGFD
jgi:hypothetical protein